MKKILMTGVILSLTGAPLVQAAENPAGKLVRGVVNVVSAPMEIPKQARAYWIEGTYKTDHFLIWTGVGSIWGMVQTVKRAGSGVWDIVSFPFARPADDEPLFKPDYVWQEWPSDPDVYFFHTVPKERNWK